MYLRTTERKNADGSVVQYYQLAESLWDPARGGSVTKVIYNFGRADRVDRGSLERLAASITRVFSDSPTDRGADSDDIQVRDSWPYGGIYVLECLWKELGIGAVLTAQARSKRTAVAFERALFAMVANRCLSPYSKLYCWEQWIREETFLPSAHGLDLHHLYFAMDFLELHKAEVEKAVYFASADLLNADVDLIFYDTTSLHFEVDDEDEAVQHKFGRDYEPLRKRGHAKNGRSDAPQVVIGLAVTRDGLPVRSWVFSGETGDVTTVERVKEDLRGWRLGRCVFVGDAGMNSLDNRRSLALGNGKYILASRMRAGDEVTHKVLARQGRYKTVADNLRVKVVVVGDGERRQRYVVCHNPAEEKRQSEHRAKLVTALTAELASMKDQKGRAHSKHTCELLSSARFGRYLQQTDDGQLLLDRKAIKHAARYDGKWVITSNDDTLTSEDLALGYKQLMRVEACWRQLKSALRLRPVFHFRPWRIQAHVTISVLALLLERIAEIRAGDTWRNIAARLEQIKVVEYDRAGARVRQTTELRSEAEELLKQLKVPMPPMVHRVEVATPAAPVESGDV